MLLFVYFAFKYTHIGKTTVFFRIVETITDYEFIFNIKALVIRPKSPVKVSQVEKDKNKLTSLYEEGYNDAKEMYKDIIKFIQ